MENLSEKIHISIWEGSRSKLWFDKIENSVEYKLWLRVVDVIPNTIASSMDDNKNNINQQIKNNVWQHH